MTALIANYVLYRETFSRIWISFLFHMGASSYERRAQCITLESETERFYVHTYLRIVMTSEWKEINFFSFFVRGVAWILMGLGRLTKRGHKLLKILNTLFENVSKLDYIALVSGYLMDNGYSLNLNTEKSEHNLQENLEQRRRGLPPLSTFYTFVYQNGTTIPFYKIYSVE